MHGLNLEGLAKIQDMIDAAIKKALPVIIAEVQKILNQGTDAKPENPTPPVPPANG